jgi:hypothetical protein
MALALQLKGTSGCFSEPGPRDESRTVVAVAGGAALTAAPEAALSEQNERRATLLFVDDDF